MYTVVIVTNRADGAEVVETDVVGWVYTTTVPKAPFPGYAMVVVTGTVMEPGPGYGTVVVTYKDAAVGISISTAPGCVPLGGMVEVNTAVAVPL